MKYSRKELLAILILVSVLMGAASRFGFQFGQMVGARSATEDALRRMAPFLQDKRNSELRRLADAYGPSRNSEYAEEWIVRDFFQDQRGGVFVDVGANHHQLLSNTYYLETALGWNGVAIEPQTKFAAGYKQFRPRTTFVPLFVSNVSDRPATLYVTGKVDSVASGVREFTEAFGEVTATTTTTSTLDDVLDRLNIPRVDFLSMDIELAEPEALEGFSIRRFTPRLVAIEAHPPVRQRILDYFSRNGYVLVGRYWQVDDENFWFAPPGEASDNGVPIGAHAHSH